MRENVIYAHNDPDGIQDFVIQLTFEHTEEGSQWGGVCLELGTSAFADTFGEVRGELRDAVILQLSEVEHLGFIGDYLNDNHVVPLNTPPERTPGFSLVG